MTLPVESRFNYITIDRSPKGNILIAINAGKTSLCHTYISKSVWQNIYEEKLTKIRREILLKTINNFNIIL